MPNLARRRKGYLKTITQPAVAAAGIAAVHIEFQISGSLFTNVQISKQKIHHKRTMQRPLLAQPNGARFFGE